MRHLIFLMLIAVTGCDSAHNAFFNPNTLVPLVGAGVFCAFDEKVSDWATEHRPIFGSWNGAKEANRSFKSILKYETYITALIPNDRIKRFGFEWATLKAVHDSTSLIKKETKRERPNGIYDYDDYGFPSHCTSTAFSLATLSNRNLEYFEGHNFKEGLQLGNICLASSVCWARVEMGAHYPSDVLVGAALGHFMSAFIHDVFLGEKEEVRFSVIPSEGGAMAQLSFNF